MIKIIKSTPILAMLLLFSSLTFSQEKNFWDQVRFGGSAGLNLGDNYFQATIAPSAIYEFNDIFATGVGLNYTYINQTKIVKTNILGGSIINLINIIPELQASAEFEMLNINRRYDVILKADDENYWLPSLFLGMGYRNNNITFGIRYDVLYDSTKSIYIDPWTPFIRVYF